MKIIFLIILLCISIIVAQNPVKNNQTQNSNSTKTINNNNNNNNNINKTNSLLNYTPIIKNYSIVDSYKFPEIIIYGNFVNSCKPYLVIDGVKHNDFKILEVKEEFITQIGFIRPHKHSSNFSIECETNGLKSNVINVQVKSKIYEHYTDQITNELVLEGIFIYENKSMFPEVTIGESNLSNDGTSGCTITKTNYYTIRCLLPFKYGCKNGIKISNIYDLDEGFTNIQICAIKPKIEKIIATVNEWEKEFVVTAIGDRLGKGAWINLKIGSSQLLDVNDEKVLEYIYNNSSDTYECSRILSSNDAFIQCKFPYDAYNQIKKNHKTQYNYVSFQQPGTFYTGKPVNIDMLQLEYLDFDSILLIFNSKYGRLIPLIVIPVLIFLIIAFIVLIIVLIVLKKKYDFFKGEHDHKKSYKDPFADPFN